MEHENSLDFNMDEMDMRFYDVAIGRWQVLDPIIHHDFSPYQAFDNNPVFWADPSGADSMTIQNGQGIIGGITLGNESGGNNFTDGGMAGTWSHIGNGNYENSVTGEITDNWQRAVYETASLFNQDTEPLKVYTVNQYIRLWEKERGRKMTKKEREVLDNGCIGITALQCGADLTKSHVPSLEISYPSLMLAEKMEAALIEDIKNNPSDYPENAKVVIFAMRFWTPNPKTDYIPDKITGMIDMSGYNYKGKKNYTNYDFGYFDKINGRTWLHANHKEPGMKIYRSTLLYYLRKLPDFNRYIFSVNVVASDPIIN